MRCARRVGDRRAHWRSRFQVPDVVDDAAYAVECAAVGEVDFPARGEVAELEQRVAWLEERLWPLPASGPVSCAARNAEDEQGRANITPVTATELKVPEAPASRLRSPGRSGERVDRVFVIRPAPRWPHLDFGELWYYRELLFRFVWRDIKVRYKQSFLGIAWALLVPLFTTAIYVLIFGKFAQMPSGELSYQILVISGLLPMQYFSSALTGSSMSLVTNANLVRKVYFRARCSRSRASRAARRFRDLARRARGLHGVFRRRAGRPGGPARTALRRLRPPDSARRRLLPLDPQRPLPGRAARASGVHGLPLISGVIYEVSDLPTKWQWILSLNLMTGVISGWRWAVVGGPARPRSASLP